MISSAGLPALEPRLLERALTDEEGDGRAVMKPHIIFAPDVHGEGSIAFSGLKLGVALGVVLA